MGAWKAWGCMGVVLGHASMGAADFLAIVSGKLHMRAWELCVSMQAAHVLQSGVILVQA